MQAKQILFPWVLAAVLGCLVAPAAAQKQEREAAIAPSDMNEVGKGDRTARQGLRPGAYITPRHRQALQAYLDKQHQSGRACLPGLVRKDGECKATGEPGWEIGEPLPRSARLGRLSAGMLATLPKAPPGNRYVLYSGDVLLIAASSRRVVDAVPLGR